MSQQSRPRASSFPDIYEYALVKLGKMGLSLRQIEALREYGLLATDNVTGFHEGRSGRGRFRTLTKAIRHVIRTGEEAFYVEMDLRNLGGLNAALGHAGANQVYKSIAAIVRKEFSEVAAKAIFFRHGGDETSAFLIHTTEEEVRGAMETVRSGVSDLARRSRLDAIPHPKHPNDLRHRGIGVHFGVCPLSAEFEEDPTLVFRHADQELERLKGGAPSYGDDPAPPCPGSCRMDAARFSRVPFRLEWD